MARQKSAWLYTYDGARTAMMTNAWEQRKLGEVLKTIPFKFYIKSPEQDGTFEIIQQGNDPIIGFANGEP